MKKKKKTTVKFKVETTHWFHLHMLFRNVRQQWHAASCLLPLLPRVSPRAQSLALCSFSTFPHRQIMWCQFQFYTFLSLITAHLYAVFSPPNLSSWAVLANVLNVTHYNIESIIIKKKKTNYVPQLTPFQVKRSKYVSH